MWGRGESGESESDWRGPGPCRHAAQHLARPTGRDSGAGQVLLGLMADLCAADAARGCAPRGREGAPLLELQEAWNRAGPVLGRGSPRRGALPVVVYAYNRPEYLREVIAGLRAARGVGDTLLVFSLDGAAREMVALVRAIDFAAVRLLFHPAHPLAVARGRARRRPHRQAPLAVAAPRGAPPPAGVPRARATGRVLEAPCRPAPASVLRTQVFEGLRETRGYDGDAVLLEEDHVASPDFLEPPPPRAAHRPTRPLSLTLIPTLPAPQ